MTGSRPRVGRVRPAAVGVDGCWWVWTHDSANALPRKSANSRWASASGPGVGGGPAGGPMAEVMSHPQGVNGLAPAGVTGRGEGLTLP